MKKSLFLVVALSLALLFTGCTSSTVTKTDPIKFLDFSLSSEEGVDFPICTLNFKNTGTKTINRVFLNVRAWDINGELVIAFGNAPRMDAFYEEPTKIGETATINWIMEGFEGVHTVEASLWVIVLEDSTEWVPEVGDPKFIMTKSY